MKKVLIVAFYFPPTAASGGMRPLAFSRYLPDFGWEPRIVTTDPASVLPYQGEDASLLRWLPQGTPIHTVSFRNPLHGLLRLRERVRRRIGYNGSNGEAPAPSNGSGDKRRAAGWTRLKHLVLDSGFAFPDKQCFWVKPALRTIQGLPPSQRPDVVLATGGPWTSLLVGHVLARRLDVPLVLDFRDPWTDVPPDALFPSSLLVRRAKRLERDLCRSAARVVANTQELCRQLQEKYPDLAERCLSISNGFDPDLCLPSAGSDPAAVEGPAREVGAPAIELCHFGTVYDNRDPAPLLRAVSELAKEHAIKPDVLRFRFVGEWAPRSEACERLARDLEAEGFLRREPPIPHDRCLSAMHRANALLILQPDYPLQIPAKIYEYIATGRPLLVLGGEGATARLVAEHGLGVCCPNQVAEIKRVLLELSRGGSELRPPSSSVRQRFHYRTLTGELARALDAVYAEQTSRV